MIFKFAKMVAPLAIVLFAVSAHAASQDGAKPGDSFTQTDTSDARRAYDANGRQTGGIPDIDETRAAEKVKLPQKVAKKDKTKTEDGAAATEDKADKKAKAAAGDNGKKKKKAKKKDDNKKDKNSG